MLILDTSNCIPYQTISFQSAIMSDENAIRFTNTPTLMKYTGREML